MEPTKSEELGRMYLPDDQGEYAPEVGAPSFSIQGLSDTLMALETMTEVQPPPEKFALQLEVMMANHRGCPCPPEFSWNMGMVLHVLKGDPTLRDLKHVQVEGSGMAYLFFFDKKGCQRLTLEAAHMMRTHVGKAFSEWISHSTHFNVNPMPLAEGLCHMMVASERWRQWSRMVYPGRQVSNQASSETDSTLLLVGSAPPTAVRTSPVEDMGCGWVTRVPTSHSQGRPPKS